MARRYSGKMATETDSDYSPLPEGSQHSESESEFENRGKFTRYLTTGEFQSSQVISKDKLRVYALEKRLASLESMLSEQSKDKKKEIGPRLTTRKKERRISNSASPPILPEVKWFNYDEFKNQFRDDECQYAIEVLDAGFDLKKQIQEAKSQLSFGVVSKPAIMINNLSGRARKSDRPASLKGISPYRVRIKSPPLLAILNKVIGYERTAWTTFARPFKPLIYYHDSMKSILSDLESNWAEIERSQPAEHWSILREDWEEQHELELNSPREGKSNNDAVTSDVVDGVEALRAMRVYVDFVDNELVPLYRQYEGQACTFPPPRVRFDDLWYLFRLGDLVFNSDITDSANGNRKNQSLRSQRPMRVYSISYPDQGTSGYSQKDKVVARCYSIDYNGESYIPVKSKVMIPYFEGEKDIDSLEIYPIRFAQDHQRILQQLTDEGNLFQRCIKERNLSCQGWTIGDHETSEYIDSNVIVDFAEALRSNPHWSTASHTPILHDAEETSPVMMDENLGTIWTDKGRTEVAATYQDEIYLGASIDARERNSNLRIDKFLNSRREKNRNIDDEDLILLPRRLFAYSLQDRKFFPVDICTIKLAVEQGEQFKDVFIAKEHKKMINAAVDSHCESKRFETEPIMANTGMSQGITQNKSGGLVILLHGVSGVGKTSTAQAVAQAKKKPLFTISCGDLGFSPSEIAASLKEIFRLAQLWDCVLLMNEADVFLLQRSSSDLKRNALVSTFVRILESYKGILFLTTSRVGTLEEAFKSRIHIILYYPPLSKNQTEGIWRMNIRKLKQIEEERHAILNSGDKSNGLADLPLKIAEEEIIEFALSHWQHHQYGKGRWNGRQIQNAFQIAAALARSEMRALAKKREIERIPNASSEPLQGGLKARHFRAVAETSHNFEMYTDETTGKKNVEIALGQDNRASEPVTRPSSQKMTERPVIHEHFSYDHRTVSVNEGSSGGEPNYREGRSLPRSSNIPGWGSPGSSSASIRQSLSTTSSLASRPEMPRSSSSETFMRFQPPQDKNGDLHLPEDTSNAPTGHRHPDVLRPGWPTEPDPKLKLRRKTQPVISGAWSGVESDFE